MSSLKLELESSRPGTGNPMDSTITSNFSMATFDVEELRQQLAQASIELEEHKAQFKKNYSKNHKDLEEFYESIDFHTNEEKKIRVKIN